MSHTREIGGHCWTVETFTGRESLALFRQLMALAAEPLSAAVNEASATLDADQDLGVGAVLALAGGAVGLAGKMAMRLSDAELEKLALRLLGQTLCDNEGAAKQFDNVFKGDPATLLRVLAFVVEVNFVAPFVSSLGPAVSSAIAQLASRAKASTPPASSATKPNP